MNKFFLSVVTVAILASCGGGDDGTSSKDITSSSKTTVFPGTGNVSSSGFYSTSISDKFCETAINMGCVGYRVGSDVFQNEAIAKAGYSVKNNEFTQTAPTVETNYTTFANWGEGRLSGGFNNLYAFEEKFTMTFDPSTDKLTGKSNSLNFKTNVSGTNFTGNFSHRYLDNNGKVEGHVNAYGLIGAFWGDDYNTVIGGDLVGWNELLYE